MTASLSPPKTTCCGITFPAPFILLVTLNRPKQLNVITTQGHLELDAVWRWYDDEPSLLVAILTGSGKAFSAGADLKGLYLFAIVSPFRTLFTILEAKPFPANMIYVLLEWEGTPATKRGMTPANGFGGLSMRRGKKPIIAALNGLVVGGSTEMVINCDMVVAAANAILALPDVKVGLTGFGGTFPRLVQRIGRSRATDMCLTGRNISADEAYCWGLINRLVKPGEDVVQAALDLAKQIAANSPDAIIATRDGLMMGEESESGTGGALEAGKKFIKKWLWLVNSENCEEGINAFIQRRAPRWKLSKL